MLVGRMVDHQFSDHFQSTAMRFTHELPEVAHGSVGGIDVLVVSDVISVVAHWRRIKRQQPQRRHAQIHQVIQLFCQSREIADPVTIGVMECLDMQLVDDGVLVP